MSALITLDVPIKVKVQENGKVIEALEVTYRYPTKKEQKEFDEFSKNMKELARKLQKLESKANILDKKIEFAEKSGDYKKAEKLLDEKERLENEAEILLSEFEENGGFDFSEKLSEKMFNVLVGGKDKEKLEEYAIRIGFEKVVSLLNKERDEYEKKQSGE